MKRRQRILTGRIVATAVLAVAAVAALVIYTRWRPSGQPVSLSGAVLRMDKDPTKQAPIANVTVTLTKGDLSQTAKSDAAGFFQLTLDEKPRRGEPVVLQFTHADYKPFEITGPIHDRLYIARMEPLAVTSEPDRAAKPVIVGNVRVRYSVKNQTTVNVGTVSKQFEVVNTGGEPCAGHAPCSPDGKWKASVGSLILDAQDGNEFRNIRVSCVAGPCPFTKADPPALPRPTRVVKVSALNWSDAADFLVEAEVERTMETENTRQSYPFITGGTMSFALPASAEGTSFEADMNGEEIVFPLGPNLNLSWATCGVDAAARTNKTYRCELKPGYQFQ